MVACADAVNMGEWAAVFAWVALKKDTIPLFPTTIPYSCASVILLTTALYDDRGARIATPLMLQLGDRVDL